MKSTCTTLCCLVLLSGLVQLQAGADSVADGAGSDLRLESDYIPQAIRLAGDTLHRAIHSVRLVGKVPAEGDGKGELWLDGRLGEPNAFGDVAQRVGTEPSSIAVELRQVPESTGQAKGQSSPGAMPWGKANASEGFRLYDLVFPDGKLEGRLKLVLGTPCLGPHRLLVYGKASSGGRFDAERLAHIVTLYGVPTITSVLPDLPLGRQIDLSGYYTAEDSRIHRLEVSGALGGTGTLAFDPNRITFDSFGEPVLFTTMGYDRPKISLKLGAGDDPSGLGRRHYWAVPEKPRNEDRVALVLGRTETGPHRFLVYHGDQLAFIVPAMLANRRLQEIAAAELTVLPEGEQQVIDELRRTAGHGFRTEIKNGQVVGLQFWGNTGGVLSDGVLARLTHLHSIQFGVGRFPANGLADLKLLGQLRSLLFDNTEFEVEGLACLKNLRQLDTLSFYDCRGIDDEGVKQLAGLTGLKRLSFYSERRLRRPPDVGPCITDAGVTHLKGLVLLERLNLEGHDLSNASVPILTGMRELQDLALSGQGLTDAGLQGLAGLAKLRSLRLIDTAVSTSGIARLKARLPGLKVEAWTHDQEHD